MIHIFRLPLQAVDRFSPIHLLRSPPDLLDTRLSIPEHFPHTHVAAHCLSVMDAVLVRRPLQESMPEHVRRQVEPLFRHELRTRLPQDALDIPRTQPIAVA